MLLLIQVEIYFTYMNNNKNDRLLFLVIIIKFNLAKCYQSLNFKIYY